MGFKLYLNKILLSRSKINNFASWSSIQLWSFSTKRMVTNEKLVRQLLETLLASFHGLCKLIWLVLAPFFKACLDLPVAKQAPKVKFISLKGLCQLFLVTLWKAKSHIRINRKLHNISPVFLRVTIFLYQNYQ